MKVKLALGIFALFAVFLKIPEAWGMYNGDDSESKDSRYTTKKTKAESAKKREKKELLKSEKILILCQGNVPLHKKALYEIDPSELLIITEKKAKPTVSGDEEYAHVSYVDDYFESGEVEFEAYNLYEKIPYDFIIASSETDILRAAQLRDRFKLKGQNYESALAFRDKVRMKQILADAGIRVPRFSRARSALDVITFIEKKGFPVILKPSFGYGSVKTQILKNSEDLFSILTQSKAFNEFHSAELEVEEYIDGEMYHVDGLVRDGEISIVWPSKCINTCLDMIFEKPTGAYLLAPENPLVLPLCEFAKLILKALPTPENAGFHLELFFKENNCVFCEIASRIGGPWVNDLWIRGLGIDLKREFIRAQAYLPPSHNLTLKHSKKVIGEIIFPPKEGKVISVPKVCDLSGVVQYDFGIEEGTDLSKPESMLGHIASFIIEADSEDEMKVLIGQITEWFQDSFKII